MTMETNPSSPNRTETKTSGVMYLYLVYLALAVIGTIVTAISSGTGYDIMLQLPTWWAQAAYTALCVYAFIAIVGHKPNAIRLAKLQCYIVIAINALAISHYFFLISITEEIGFNPGAEFFRQVGGVIAGAAFLLYFYHSDSVVESFPPAERRWLKGDRTAIISAVCVFILLIGAAVWHEIKDTEREQSGSYVIDDDAEYYDMFEIDMDSLFDAGFPEEPMEFLSDEEEAPPAPSADDF